MRICEYKKPGDQVEYFDNAAKALGVVFLQFVDKADMKMHLDSITDEIKIVLQ